MRSPRKRSLLIWERRDPLFIGSIVPTRREYNQAALAENAENLREVVIYGLKPNREAVMFPGYAEFLAAMGFKEEKNEKEF